MQHLIGHLDDELLITNLLSFLTFIYFINYRIRVFCMGQILKSVHNCTSLIA